MKIQTFILTIALFFNLICSGQKNVTLSLNNYFNSSSYKNAGLGILVVNANTREVILKNKSQLSMIPGSIQKLVTTGAALEILGGDYCFETKLSYSGKIDTVAAVLNGNLIIKGNGDPILGSDYFEEFYFNPHFLDVWTDSIIAKGIKSINGSIILDCSDYEEQTVPNTWIWEDIGNYYGAGAGAISIYDNTIKINFKSGTKAGDPTQIIGVTPNIAGLHFENKVTSSENESDLAYVYGSPWSKTKIIRGTIPKKKDQFTVKASMPEPEFVLGNKLLEKLNNKGVRIRGTILKVFLKEKSTKYILSQKSPLLTEIIKVMNHESVNLIAEHLAKQIAYEETGLGSTKIGLGLIKEFWKEKNIDTHGMFLEDGSGLSHFNAITPQQMIDILLYMRNESPCSKTFLNSLPSPGEGTLYVFDPDDFPNSSLRCKSGSMTRIRCYTGFLSTMSGKELAFVFMVNNFEGSHSGVIDDFEKFLIELRNRN